MIRTILFGFVFLQATCFAKYHSQCGQDQYVNEALFKNIRNGVFLDIGAHNGISLSNTYFFENELGWTGLCMEPIPEVYTQLTKNRRCICVQGCAARETYVGKFLRISGPLEMLSGLIDEYDPKHTERIQRQLAEYGGSYEIIPVQCYNVNDLLEKNGIRHVNFLSLDTEGGELKILQSIDFSKIQIDVITVENNYNDPRFIPFLESKGFKNVHALEQDLIFVHKNFHIKR